MNNNMCPIHKTIQHKASIESQPWEQNKNVVSEIFSDKINMC
jgi:hypothetical protein